MTTPTDDENLQQQPDGTEDGDDLDDELDAGADDTAGGGTEAATEGVAEEGEPVAADAEAEKLSEVEHHKAQTKTFRDKYASTKGEAETLRKMAQKLEAEGLLDRDELAKDIGVKRDYLDAVIDRKDLPEPGEDGHVQQLVARFTEDFQNPTIQKAVNKLYGDKAAQEEILQAFDFAVANDPSIREKYVNTSPDDVLYFAMDQGKAALEDFREVQQLGATPTALMSEIRRLRTENAALKKGKVTTQANETEETTEQEEVPAPKSAREARVRAFMN